MSAEHSELTCRAFRRTWHRAASDFVDGNQLDVARSINLALHSIDCGARSCKSLSLITNLDLAGLTDSDQIKELLQSKIVPRPKRQGESKKPVPITSLADRSEGTEQRAA